MMKKQKAAVLEYLGFACLFLTIITFCITVTINFRPLYVFDIEYLNLLDYTTIGKKELIANFDQLMQYLSNPFITKLVLPDFPMSASGAFHFYEVKKLFLLNYGILLLTIVPSCFFWHYLKKNDWLWRLKRPFKIGLFVPFVLLFLMVIGFNQFFVQFHSIFFNNDAWLFDPATDPIIDVLPETFFMHCFLLFFLLLEVLFYVNYQLGKRHLNRKLNSSIKDTEQ